MEGHRNLSLEKVKQFGFIIHSNNETSNLRNYHGYNAVIFDHNMNIWNPKKSSEYLDRNEF